MSAVLIDTNLLIYAFQTSKDIRVSKAKMVLADAARTGSGCVSLQNITEFCSVCLTKLKPRMTPGEVANDISAVLTMFKILPPSYDTVLLALSAVESHKLAFWDAMIWATAQENCIDTVYSEDFQDGRTLGKVRFSNPLK